MAYKIINKPTTTLAQMKAWAKNVGAKEFEKLAEPCYKASLITGVDPAVSYALSALETGWCYKNSSSTAGLDASFHNPAGLKIRQGGSDFNKEAHQRFKNWEDGYLAQQQHLALYAGASGYPLKNPLDPRHFPYLLGVAKNVEDLGGKGKWNRNVYYGDNILKLIDSLINTKYIKEEGDNMLECVVLYNGDADVFASIILSQKLACTLMKKIDFESKKIKAKKIHYVGGNPNERTRFDTFKNVANQL